MCKYLAFVAILACCVFSESAQGSPVNWPVQIPVSDSNSWEPIKGLDGRPRKMICREEIPPERLRWVEFHLSRKEMNKSVGITIYLDYADEENYSCSRVSFSPNGHYNVRFWQKVDGQFRELLYHGASCPERDASKFRFSYALLKENRASFTWKLGRISNGYYENIVPIEGHRIGYGINEGLVVTRISLVYDRPRDVRSQTAEQVANQIADLRRLIIPPKGTTKADVDAVFGQAKVVEKPAGKGEASIYPMHCYELLPPKSGQSFRAVLNVAYRERKVHLVEINHLRVVKERDLAPGVPPSPEILAERRGVLADLLEIDRKYRERLEIARWNLPVDGEADSGSER